MDRPAKRPAEPDRAEGRAVARAHHPRGVLVVGRGGADTVIKSLVGALQAQGGELHLGTPVDTVSCTGNRARAVALRNGRTFEATRAVIAGPGTMMVHYALSRLPDWTAGAALQRFAYVHLAPDFATMARAYDDARAGWLPAVPALVVGQPTALDPSRAPEGRHILWVQVRVLPAEVRGDAAGNIAAGSWDDIKERYADRVEALIEGYAPGFKASVLGRAVLSPADLERDNVNLIGGDSLGGSHHLDQNFMFRPAFGWSRYKTPVKNLHLVGASTWPGAGVGAGSGFMLGKMLAGA